MAVGRDAAADGGATMQALVLAQLREDALAAVRAGRTPQAVACLHQALSLADADPDLWALLGAISPDQEVRAACARRALALDPAHPAARALLAGETPPLEEFGAIGRAGARPIPMPSPQAAAPTPDPRSRPAAAAVSEPVAPAPDAGRRPLASDPPFRLATPRLAPAGRAPRLPPWAIAVETARPAPAPPRPRARPRLRPAWTPRLRRYLLAAGVLLLVALANLLLAAAYERRYAGRIVPGVRVAGLTLGGFTPAEAEARLQQELAAALAWPLRLTYEERAWTFTAQSLGLRYRAAEAVRQAAQIGHRPSPWLSWRERAKVGLWGTTVPLEVETQGALLEAALDQVCGALDRPAVPPEVDWDGREWVLRPGQDGRHVQRDELRADLLGRLAGLAHGAAPPDGQPIGVAVPVAVDSAALSEGEARRLRQQLEWAGRPLAVTCADYSRILGAADIAPWVRVQLAPPLVTVDTAALRAFLESLDAEVAVPVQRPRLQVQDGRAVVFQLGRAGRALDMDVSLVFLENALNRRLRGEEVEAVELPTREVPAGEDALIAEFGVAELIGQGRSSFADSSWARVTNIVVGGRELNGWLVAPGEVFSLNEALDPVTWEKGYVMSEIISGGQVGWGLGGGLCQLATTVYRAALNAGLEIVERQPHSWRLEWYEQDSPPGFDATIMIGGPDLKFRNTTGHYLLIQVETDAEAAKQVVSIYGTSPGWQVTIDNVIDGGGSVSFHRRVTAADGTVLIDETVYSHYW